MKSLGEWQKLGIVRANGEPYPRQSDKASLFSPEGTRGPSFLLLNNFRSLLRYNVAKSYALAVGHLSDRIRGGGRFVQAWPTDETHLSLEQRMELQQYLITQGILEGEPDGVIGRGTLEAIKTYQRSKGLGVDGFPSLTLLKRLRSETPPPAAMPASAGEEQPGNTGAIPPANTVAPQAETGGVPAAPADAAQQ
jgi:membrane-bound lytic murein transglycosylase B